MEVNLWVVLIVFLALSGGALLGYYVRQTVAKKQLGTAEGKALKIVEEADEKAKDMILESKSKAVV